MRCAAASNFCEQLEDETMIRNWQNSLLAALSMFGAGLEGMNMKMA
jgi:hypothetical protein